MNALNSKLNYVSGPAEWPNFEDNEGNIHACRQSCKYPELIEADLKYRTREASVPKKVIQNDDVDNNFHETLTGDPFYHSYNVKKAKRSSLSPTRYISYDHSDRKNKLQ